jgi:hypothetical protein
VSADAPTRPRILISETPGASASSVPVVPAAEPTLRLSLTGNLPTEGGSASLTPPSPDALPLSSAGDPRGSHDRRPDEEVGLADLPTLRAQRLAVGASAPQPITAPEVSPQTVVEDAAIASATDPGDPEPTTITADAAPPAPGAERTSPRPRSRAAPPARARRSPLLAAGAVGALGLAAAIAFFVIFDADARPPPAPPVADAAPKLSPDEAPTTPPELPRGDEPIGAAEPDPPSGPGETPRADEREDEPATVIPSPPAPGGVKKPPRNPIRPKTPTPPPEPPALDPLPPRPRPLGERIRYLEKRCANRAPSCVIDIRGRAGGLSALAPADIQRLSADVDQCLDRCGAP